MKPALFNYVVPATVDDAVAALAADDMARPLAGGQSLIPTLNFRIASPTTLVDLRKLSDLRGISVSDDAVRIGAMTRHRELELDEAAHRANPLIREVLGNVAHIAIRNRGTIGGSLAHADAAAELPALLLATEGDITAVGLAGARTVAANDLFQFHMMTSLAPGELLTEVRIPAMPANTGGAFLEFARRKGDYALAGVCAVITVADDGSRCTTARLSACGVGSRAVRLPEAEEALTGSALDTADLETAGQIAGQSVDPPDDVHGTKKYRRHLTSVLLRRAVALATSRARGEA